MDAFKEVVFEKLARTVFENNRARIYNQIAGNTELVNQCIHQTLGVHQAVIALGYTNSDFETYYNKKRQEYRNEIENNRA